MDDLFAGPQPWEPNYFDYDTHLSRVHWTTTRSIMLEGVLNKARSGQLESDWRDRLTLPERRPGYEERYSDSDRVALQEIRELPIASWEPGVANTWRQALDAWFLAIREVVNDLSLLREEMSRENRQGRHRNFRSSFGPDELATAAVDTIIGNERIFDAGAYSALEQGIILRDRMTAWYKAGRAAGGDDVDWLAWFEERIGHWMTPTIADWERASLSRAEYRERLLSLPDYWQGA
ncbi:Uncharacterised protein [Mycobacteroides abscessus subsp. abscessus]|uniref:hypothetical protein n=1 Tax=Mycobacteroides abscessus TaxID=36809 RepID=UPI00092C2FE4|nr:hypothetical protein [Mycobacteroides abscessus]SIJ22243.1 Uncharacterised protein [Mycobacteroides abscessus subsp. abscessus]SLH38478.1 Uncharacterised protein [Mycobacteroides abscessus subsp. abscessus]